jgi:hypothetical protein
VVKKIARRRKSLEGNCAQTSERNSEGSAARETLAADPSTYQSINSQSNICSRYIYIYIYIYISHKILETRG